MGQRGGEEEIFILMNWSCLGRWQFKVCGHQRATRAELWLQAQGRRPAELPVARGRAVLSGDGPQRADEAYLVGGQSAFLRAY